MISFVFSFGCESEGITTSTSFRDTETANSVSRQPRKILGLQRFVPEFADDSVGYCILYQKSVGGKKKTSDTTYMNVTESAYGRIHLGKFFDSNHRTCKRAFSTTQISGCFKPHQLQ
jgi:hypothetical protein